MPVFGGRRGQQRICKRMLWGLCTGVCLLGLAWLAKPLGTIRQQSVSLAELRAREAALLARQQDLERYRRFLSTGKGRETTARRAGYLKQGERRLVFVPEKPKTPQADPGKPTF